MFFGFALPCGFMGTRGSLALQSIFIKEQESSFLTDLPHHQNPKGRKNIIISQETVKGLPKYVSQLSAPCKSCKQQGRAPGSFAEKMGEKRRCWSPSGICCPEQHLQLHLSQKNQVLHMVQDPQSL